MTHPSQPPTPWEHLTDAEYECYIDALWTEWTLQNEAYRFEDNYEPFETRPNNC
jgi:hypothetical protein